ncbi:MAG TPA: CHAT domain-containing protein [Pyrinomonadaceae bacterium]
MGKIRLLFLSANPWSTSRIRIDEEARAVFDGLQAGPYRDNFEWHNHSATQPVDLQRLLMIHQPHIVHFCGHGSKSQRIILGGSAGKGRSIDIDGLRRVLALYGHHVNLVVLNACFTAKHAVSASKVINYSIGTENSIGDKASVSFSHALYRALSFGRSVKEAFESAQAELALARVQRSRGIALFIRDGLAETNVFPRDEHLQIALPFLNRSVTIQRTLNREIPFLGALA